MANMTSPDILPGRGHFGQENPHMPGHKKPKKGHGLQRVALAATATLGTLAGIFGLEKGYIPNPFDTGGNTTGNPDLVAPNMQPTISGATETPVPTATVEVNRPIMAPQEIQAPAELTAQLKKEMGDNTEVLHYYQGEYIHFGFLMDSGLTTRTEQNTNYGMAKQNVGQVTTMTDFALSGGSYERYTGQTVPQTELIKRMENTFLLLDINQMRNQKEFKDVFPVYDSVNDPNDLQVLAQMKEMIRTGHELKGVIDGVFIDPSQDHFLKFTKDNPGGFLPLGGGLGYGRQSLQGGTYKGSEAISFWVQYLPDEKTFIANAQVNINKGIVPPNALDSIIKGHPWTGFEENYLDNLFIRLGNSSDVKSYDNQLLLVNTPTSIICIFDYKN